MKSTRLVISLALVLVEVSAVRRTTYHCSNNSTNNGEVIREPITSLTFVSAKQADFRCPNSYEKIDVDLNAGAGGSFIFACVTRGDANNRYGVPLSDISITTSTSKKVKAYCPEGSTRLSMDLNLGAGGDFIYFCTSRFGPSAITDLTFVKDEETCPAHYYKLPENLNSGTESKTKIFACVEKKCDVQLESPEVFQFREDKTFKIAQFTDSHFGEYYEGDILCAQIYRNVITTEDPDAVVLTGDQVSGYAWDETPEWFAEMYGRVLDSILSLGYSYFYLVGNHDPQADLTQRQIVSLDLKMGGKLTFTQLGPENITGASNYYIPVYSSAADTSDKNALGVKDVAYNLWVLDSNGYNCEDVTGWGCIAQDQVTWYREKAASLAAQSADGKLPPALAYFHIPVDEYLQVAAAEDSTSCSGTNGEAICCSSVNTGVFQAFKDVGDVTATFVGHDHDNDFSFSYKGISLYYGRKTGYGGYGPPPLTMQRGSRIAVLKEGVRGLSETWIRQEDGSRMDLKQCGAVDSQAKCCGMAAADETTVSRAVKAVYSAVTHATHTTSTSTEAVRVSEMSDIVPFKQNFESKFETKPDKCQLYEAAYRQAMKDNTFDPHAKTTDVKK